MERRELAARLIGAGEGERGALMREHAGRLDCALAEELKARFDQTDAGDPAAGAAVAGVLAAVAAVADDGLLIYETFARGNERLGRPANPDFLLEPGELLAAIRPRLTAIAYEHVRLEDPAGIVQRLCASGPGHRWLAEGGPLG